MSSRVFVISKGLISSIGNNVAECVDSISKLKQGLSNVELFETGLKYYPTGEIKADDENLAKFAKLNYNNSFTRTTLLAAVAIRQAIDGMKTTLPDKINFGLISGTTVGGMRRTENNYDKYFKNSAIRTHDCGNSTMQLRRMFGFNGYSTTISTACSSSANSIMLAARMISSGKLDAAIAGGTDSLTRFTMNGFNSLMILDKNQCRPFDRNRAGINLGEGAAYLILASSDILSKYGIEPMCELAGWANTNDAFHQTASSPDGYGAYLSMSTALNKAGLKPDEIDYINAHGTGTPNNDLSEGLALQKVFGDAIPPFSSTKPFTGHTLGAAGAIESVLSCLAIENNVIYPNLNFYESIDELGLRPNTSYMENANVRNVLTNSFGFGGNNTTLIFSAC